MAVSQEAARKPRKDVHSNERVIVKDSDDLVKLLRLEAHATSEVLILQTAHKMPEFQNKIKSIAFQRTYTGCRESWSSMITNFGS